MRTSKLVAIGSVLASYVWVLAGGCSSGGSDDANGPSGPGPGKTMEPGMDAATIMSDAMGVGGSDSMPLNELCGEATVDEQCLPDDQQACANFRPPVIKPPLGSGGEGGAESGGEGGRGGVSDGGAGLGGESAGQSTGGMFGEAGAPSSGGADAGASGQGGAAGSGSDPVGPARYGCQITRPDNVTSRSCERAGEGAINAPCFSSADCKAGLACVVDGQAGRCLQYCCSGDAACLSGSYCATQQLRRLSQDDGSEPPPVPVCVPADDCSLEEPFPCTDGTECRCKDNTACLVVRDDGTTTCRTPGEGQQGEACPCAWNHVCSSVTNKCVKICNTDPSKNECGEQKCQASSELPQNFGVCVGPVK